MSILNVEHLTHGFGDRAIFEDVSFRLLKGEHIGLVGANGEGKSTFMKVLSGELEPNKGEVIIPKNERLSVLEQNQEKYNDYTVLRTVLMGHKRLVEIMDRLSLWSSMVGMRRVTQRVYSIR